MILVNYQSLLGFAGEGAIVNTGGFGGGLAPNIHNFIGHQKEIGIIISNKSKRKNPTTN